VHFVLELAASIPQNVHRGAVLPLARFVVLIVPVGALCFYVFVVRARRK